jgi:hypothetical protein
MTIKIDLANQVRQTTLPRWKPLLPLFEAIINSIQAIKDAQLAAGIPGEVTVEIERENDLFDKETPAITGFAVTDNGIGFDDDNFDSFNTAYSSRKIQMGGKGLGRFTWLKAFDQALITSTFLDDRKNYLTRDFKFDQAYDLDERGLPEASQETMRRTTVRLTCLRPEYRDQVPRSTEVLIQKIIEHFILVLLEADCPRIVVIDNGLRHDVNRQFEQEYRTTASSHTFELNGFPFRVNGFRLPTSRTTRHKLVYAADRRAVQSDRLDEYVPNLRSRLEDRTGRAFFYLGIVQSPYLSQHVSLNRTDFDFSVADDGDIEDDDLLEGEQLIPKAAIRDKVLECVQSDLKDVIESINSAKLNRVHQYVSQEAPQYRILLKSADRFLDRLSPLPPRAEIEAVLHRELFNRETELKRQSTRIIKEAEKIDDYEDYGRKFTKFLDEYNELGASALAQYVQHRKIILEFLERAINLRDGEKKFPLEKVVHQLVFPMQTTSDDIPYNQQNLWMIDERLTYHSFISSDKPNKSLRALASDDAQRGDIVIFDEKILFSDDAPTDKPLNSIVVIEFKQPGRTNYREGENPVLQAANVINAIRASKFKVDGRILPVANPSIPASIFCVADLTPRLRRMLIDFDANVTPDNQGFYGYHKTHNVYYEVIDYTKMLQDAKKRNRIFFEKLNLVSNR